MSLEEIESRLGSLIHADTISQLKSAVWKERLEGYSLSMVNNESHLFLRFLLSAMCSGPLVIMEGRKCIDRQVPFVEVIINVICLLGK